MKQRFTFIAGALALFCTNILHAAGTLTPADSGLKPAEIVSHDVNVVINNGFARTEVTQRFRNPNSATIEALYRFPLPQSASLSEVNVTVGEDTIAGEVVDRKTADRIYGEEKAKGNTAAKAEKNGYQDFTFAVANIASGQEALVTFVYYQPLPVDTGTVRYAYPLEEGNTADTAAINFWTGASNVTAAATLKLTLKSAWPLAALRAPGLNPSAQDLQLDQGTATLEYDLGNALDKDFIFYYQLAELPGRLEVIPYRAEGAREGTFMMVLTPGIDLQPLDQGADYLFVLDVSGSMSGEKIRTLCDGVAQTLGQMTGKDRFRIITFNTSAREHTPGWIPATPANVADWCQKTAALQASGGTDIHAGLAAAVKRADADRVTSLILVTDGVANSGIVSPKAFRDLMQKQDLRVFGFLMGNSGNWPLMRAICDASGGFYAAVSNSDDIIGQILLAKSKICYEALHAPSVTITGAKTADLTGHAPKKCYRGQQLVIFGRYLQPGPATVRLDVKLSGRKQSYACDITFPAADTDNPELERLWAMSHVEMAEDLASAGLLPPSEAADKIRDLGLRYQLVTDETSMLVLTDDAFRAHGIDRHNQARSATERAAQTRRAAAPVRNYRADTPANRNPSSADTPDATPRHPDNNMFTRPAPRTGRSGGGAVNETLLIIGIALAGIAASRTSARRHREANQEAPRHEADPDNLA